MTWKNDDFKDITAKLSYPGKAVESGLYVKQEPYVGEDGIYIPVHDYMLAGSVCAYRCAITKEMFVEAYNKWIKGEE